MNGYSLEDVINRIILPRLDKIEEQLRNGTSWGREQVNSAATQVAEVRRDLEDLKRSLLTEQGVEQILTHLLEKGERRGWTHREQKIKTITVVCVVVGVILTVTSTALTLYSVTHR